MTARERMRYSWLLPLLVLALVLAGCDSEPVPVEPIEPIEATEPEAVTLPDEVEEAEEPGTPVIITPPITPEGTPMPEAPLLIRASQLVGLDIETARQEDLGEVEAVLVDESGSLRFVVFDAGGFLGVGERMIAVEWHAFSPNPPTMGQAEHEELGELIFMAPAETLQDAQVIEAINPDARVIRAEAGNLPPEFDGLIRVGGVFSDFELLNRAGEDLGEVEDVILDVHAGQAEYGVVDVGGFLGVPENVVAVPWDRFAIEAGEADEAMFVLDVTDETLRNAPVWEPEEWTLWPQPANPGFDADTREYWETVG